MKNFMGSAIFRVLTLAAQMVLTVWITRTAGPDGFGLYALLVVNAGWLQLFSSLGLSSGITHFAAGGLASQTALRKLILISTWLQLGVLVVVEFASRAWSGHGFVWPSTGAWPLVMGSLFFLSISLQEKYAALLLGQHRQAAVNRIAFYTTVLTIVALVLYGVMVKNITVDGVISMIIVFSIIQAIWLGLRTPTPNGHTEEMSGVRLEWKALLAYALVNYLANALQFLAYRVDYWILDHYHGREQLGVYALAVRMAQLLWVLPTVAASILFPMGSSGQANPAQVGVLVRGVSFFSFLAALAMALFAKPLLPPVFGPDFINSVIPLWLLLPGVWLFTINLIIAAWFAGSGRPKYNMWISLVSLAVIVSLDFLWIPAYGAKGAALASTIAYGTSALLSVVIFVRHDRQGMFKIIPGREDVLAWKSIFTRHSASSMPNS